jgi:hypothetical protein
MAFEKIMRSGPVNTMARVDYRRRPQPKGNNKKLARRQAHLFLKGYQRRRRHIPHCVIYVTPEFNRRYATVEFFC